MYEGRWISYRPWVYNPHNGTHYAGRPTTGHLVVGEDDSIATFACGKEVPWFDMADSNRRDVPHGYDRRYFLKDYCKGCLASVGIDKPRDRTRDYQRRRVYEAEWSIEFDDFSDFVASDVEEAQTYVDLLMDSTFVRETFGDVNRTRKGNPRPVRVRARRGNQGRGHANAREIALGALAMTEYTILHELAHTIHRRARALTGPDWGSRQDSGLDHSGHGKVFVGILLALVDEFLGRERGDRLRDALREKRVKWDEWEEIRP